MIIEMIQSIRCGLIRCEDYLISEYFSRYGTRIAFVAYAFVFFYYGLLKLIPGVSTPIQSNVAAFMSGLGVPTIVASFGLPYDIGLVMVFIGIYEVTLGILFGMRRMRAAFFLFFIHQFTTLTTLFVAPEAYFQQPFLEIAGLSVPWLFDTFAAYVLKNTIFIGGFLILTSIELGHEPPKAATHAENQSWALDTSQQDR